MSAQVVAGEDVADDEEVLGGCGKDAAVKAAAKGKLLSHIVKRNVMQNVVPTMAALKHVLEKAHSPLLGALMTCLAHMLKDYRSGAQVPCFTRTKKVQTLTQEVQTAQRSMTS